MSDTLMFYRPSSGDFRVCCLGDLDTWKEGQLNNRSFGGGQKE